MNINSVQNIGIHKGYNSLNASTMKTKEKSSFSKNTLATNAQNIPASAYKANFLPSFGGFKRIKYVPLMDKNTGKEVMATLHRENIGDFVMFKLLVNRQEAGYLDMICDSIFPEDDYVLTEPDNNIPEVRHLRSILGDKYHGIGTELINAAVEESKKRGKQGALWLETEQGYAHSLSKYRSHENPIPFYYKIGFKSLNEKIDELIKKSIETSNYGLLPSSTVLLLSSDRVNEANKYYASHYSYA